ncbi:MAG: hypothetical protein ACI4JK_02100 [Oscillospiraceae bacterium]
MGRPSKTAGVIKAEGKSHRTKAELKAREEAEQSVLSGKELFERSEVKNNRTAHKEFLRVSKLMSKIGKNDALYSSGINTYCELYSEIIKLEKDIHHIEVLAETLEEKFNELKDLDFEQVMSFTRQIIKLQSQKVTLGTAIDRKRNMMLAIDKENVMTISAALRNIPKTPQKKENPLLAALADDEDDEAEDK